MTGFSTFDGRYLNVAEWNGQNVSNRHVFEY